MHPVHLQASPNRYQPGSALRSMRGIAQGTKLEKSAQSPRQKLHCEMGFTKLGVEGGLLLIIDAGGGGARRSWRPWRSLLAQPPCQGAAGRRWDGALPREEATRSLPGGLRLGRLGAGLRMGDCANCVFWAASTRLMPGCQLLKCDCRRTLNPKQEPNTPASTATSIGSQAIGCTWMLAGQPGCFQRKSQA